MRKLLDRLRALLRWAYHWGRRHIPPGARSIVGILLIVGGVFGFLPILGFWMVPVGVVLLALDVPGLRRWLGARLEPSRPKNAPDRDRGSTGRSGGDH